MKWSAIMKTTYYQVRYEDCGFDVRRRRIVPMKVTGREQYIRSGIDKIELMDEDFRRVWFDKRLHHETKAEAIQRCVDEVTTGIEQLEHGIEKQISDLAFYKGQLELHKQDLEKEKQNEIR